MASFFSAPMVSTVPSPLLAGPSTTCVVVHAPPVSPMVKTRIVLVPKVGTPKRASPNGRLAVEPVRKKRRVASTLDKMPAAQKVRKVSRTSSTTSRASSSGSPPGTRASSRASSRLGSTVPATPNTFSWNDSPIDRPCGIIQDGDVQLTHASDVVRSLIHMYKPYFSDPADLASRAFDVEGEPTVELEYPNTNAREKFLLLQPKDPDHYNPIYDLRSAVHVIIENFVPPEDRKLFGTATEQITLPSDMNMFCHQSDPIPDPPEDTAARQYKYGNITHGLAYTFNRHDGPKFIEHIQNFNKLMRELKCSGPGGENVLMKHVASWPGMYPKVVKTIVEQTYQRCVGPKIKDLRDYTAFSSNVYGELMPNFIGDIIRQTNIQPDQHILDLGCGVGNVVLQTALQTGCSATGIEIMKKPAKLAQDQREHLEQRRRLWGVSMGVAKTIQGDFREHNLAYDLQHADVVVVNNYAFEPKLNDELSRLFLDLKEGAIVVSLKPFVPSNWRLKEFNAESPVAILRVEEREFRPGMVSWCVKGGTYYLNHIDRSMLREFAERGASTPTRSIRGTRRVSR